MKLNRRAFFKAAAAAPVAAHLGQLEQAAALAQSAGVNIVAGAMPPMAGGVWMLRHPAVRALWATGALPDWVRDEVETAASYESRHYMEADIACLRSVSLSAKLGMSRDRRIRQTWANAARMIAMQDARAALLGGHP